MAKWAAVARQRTSPAGRGFALLEVLIASAILGVAAAALIWAISQSQGTLEGIADRRQAVILAETLLEEYRLGLLEPQGAPQGYPAWRWQAKERNTPQGKELSVTVSWPKAGGQGKYTLTTLVGSEL